MPPGKHLFRKVEDTHEAEMHGPCLQPGSQLSCRLTEALTGMSHSSGSANSWLPPRTSLLRCCSFLRTSRIPTVCRAKGAILLVNQGLAAHSLESQRE